MPISMITVADPRSSSQRPVPGFAGVDGRGLRTAKDSRCIQGRDQRAMIALEGYRTRTKWPVRIELPSAEDTTIRYR